MTRVLALHGFAGGPSSYDTLRGLLPSSIAWSTPTLAGHGARPRAALDFDAEVAWLLAGVGADERPLLLGYSLGGRLALGMMVAQPDRFSGAVLVGAHLGLADPSARADRLREDGALADELRRVGVDAFFEAWESRPLFDTQRALSPDVRDGRRRLRREHDPRALADALVGLSLGNMPDTRSSLARLAPRLRFVAGALDVKFAGLAAEGARLVRNSPVLVPGVGHDVILECPDAVAQVVLSSLGGVG